MPKLCIHRSGRRWLVRCPACHRTSASTMAVVEIDADGTIGSQTRDDAQKVADSHIEWHRSQSAGWRMPPFGEWHATLIAVGWAIGDVASQQDFTLTDA